MALSGPPLDQPIQPPQLLQRGLIAKPDDPALVSAEARWSWRELDEASGRLAANLLGLGLRPGDRVASLMPNRTALLVHYLACMKAGLVATPLNYRYMPPGSIMRSRSARRRCCWPMPSGIETSRRAGARASCPLA